jgi:hypothetical protein
MAAVSRSQSKQRANDSRQDDQFLNEMKVVIDLLSHVHIAPTNQVTVTYRRV